MPHQESNPVALYAHQIILVASKEGETSGPNLIQLIAHQTPTLALPTELAGHFAAWSLWV